MSTITYRQEMRNCGKIACRRCRDGPAHGPYWYAYWRGEDGKVHKRYHGKTPPPVPTTGSHEALSRETPEWSASRLHIRMLGGLEIQRGGTPLTAGEKLSLPACRLLAILLLHPAGLAREEAAEMLWPERAPGVAERALRAALTALRSLLNSTSHQRIPRRQSLLCLNLQPGDWVDTHAFSDVQRAERADLVSIQELVALYRGELLPEFRYEPWAANFREMFRARWHSLSLLLAQRLSDSTDAAACRHLQNVLRDDGTQEEAARLLMTLLSRQGRRAEALDVYRRLVRSLDVELRVAPDRLSSALAKQLGSDDSIGTPASAPREMARRLQEQIEHLAQQRGPETARRITRLSGHRALALDRLGRSQEALTLIEGAQLAAVEGGQTAELARLLVAKAQVYQRQGHSGLAENAASEGQRLAEQTGERGLVAWSQRLRAQAAQHMGDGEKAIGLARSSTSLYLNMGLPAEALRSRRIVALTVWYSGRHREAETLYRQDLEEARTLLDLEQQAYILCGLGSALRALGSLDSAQTHLLEALALATRLEEHFLILSVEYHLANLWVDRADTLQPVQSLAVQRAREEAQRRFERVMRLAQASDSRYMLVFGAIDLAMSLAQWGSPAECHPLLQLAGETAAGLIDTMSPTGWILLAEAEVAKAEGRAEFGLERVTRAIPLLSGAAPAGLSQAHRLAGTLQYAMNNRQEATTHWMSSLAAAAQCGQAVEELRTRRAMAAGP